MAAYKDTWNNYGGKSWRVTCYYTDWKGKRVRHDKRGFKTKKEAAEYEREFLAKKTKDTNMGFGTFIDIYLDDIRSSIKPTTMVTKENIIKTHIRSYFENKSLSEISSTDILQWQNAMLSLRDENGKGYSPTYLRTVQNQMSAIFNHAVKYYDLPKNPCIAHRKMGKAKAPEMMFWTNEEYCKFIEKMIVKPMSYYAFQMLYWTGIRCGELLALTKSDFDFEASTVRITRNFQVINGREVIQTPKSEKGVRTIDLPEFLLREIQDYIDSLYRVSDDTRIFPVTKSYLHHELDRGAKAAGVKRIRLHDLRHSNVALLVNLGYSAVQIGDRLGHESTTITDRYVHLFPSIQKEMVKKMDALWEDKTNG